MTEIRWNEPALAQLLTSREGPVGRDLTRRALNVENTQKRLLKLHGSGRVYTTTFFIRGGKLYRGRARVPHQASAPGAPPASDTGRLAATISHAVGVDEHGLYADIGSGANPAIPGVHYAIYLELGWFNEETGSIGEPRPFLRPSILAAAE